MRYIPTWKERLEDAQRFVLPAVAGVIVLGVAIWVWQHGWEPRAASDPLAPPTKEVAVKLSEMQRASADVDRFEKAYHQALEAGRPDDAAAQLAHAITRQRVALRLDPGVNPEQTARLTQLESARGALQATAAAVRSMELEREAVAAQQAGQTAGTVEQLREALRLQREANTNAAPGGAQDFPRETRLAQAIERTQSEPLRVAIETALTLARSAAAREQWDDALKAFTEARTAQAELNARFPAAPAADPAGLGAIDAEIATLRAAGLAAATRAREREGDAAAAAGRVQEAAALYASAAEWQRQLDEKFPQSRFRLESTARAGELAVKRDTIMATALLARATALDHEIASALARRQTVAANEKIVSAVALVGDAKTNYPKSNVADAALQTKLAYLSARRAKLDGLQAEVYARLVTVPGAEKIRMLKTETPQDLYSRVMDANPSRNTGRALPVDSVSWVEAQEFCRRLSWVLGLTVRLPTEAEFRAAWVTDGGVWSAETSGGRSHEAGEAKASRIGVHDLAGNLAEWLQPDTEAGETVSVAGGSYLDAADALAALPLATMDRRERARHIGFRVVVEGVPK